MVVYCTYCSADKNDAKKLISAIELYKSERIDFVFNIANKNNARFVILSGKYGIIDAHEKIEYYDHLLKDSEVKTHSDLVATQIISKNINEMVFFMSSMEKDKNLKPYLMCIQKACELVGVTLDVKVFVD